MASSILVRRVCGLGDLILTLPFLRALWQENRKAELHLMAHGEHTAFFHTLRLISQGFPEEGSGWHHLYSETEVEWKELKPDPRYYDFIYLFVPDPRKSTLVASLTRTLGSKVKAIASRPRSGERIHASQHYLDHLSHASPSPSVPFHLETSLWDPIRCEQAASLRRDRGNGFFPVMVHPGSGGAQKNWPVDRFVESLRMLEVLPQVRPWIIEGPADGTIVRAILGGLEAHADIMVLRCPRLLDLAACLQEVSLFVGNDSGVTHLAAFLGVPTIALFGPSDPVQWAPLGPRVRVLYHEESCAPCHLTGEWQCTHEACIRFPTAQELQEAVSAFLAIPSPPQKDTS